MVTPFPFDFRKRQPNPPLSRFVESIWYARGTVPYRNERIAPTGSTVAVIVLGDPIVETARNGEGDSVLADMGFVVGPHDGPVINEPTGETHAVGIVTTPVGSGAVLGVHPAALRGRVMHVFDAWPPARSLRDRLLAIDDPEEMLDLVSARLQAELRPPERGLDRTEGAVALLEADPTRAIADIAEHLGVSHAHLDREFTTIVGLTPRALARLLRMRRLLHDIEVHGEVGWAALAVEWGWYDQAHLIRDFKRHTGVTPTRYLEAQRSVLPSVDSVDAAGFVPQD